MLLPLVLFGHERGVLLLRGGDVRLERLVEQLELVNPTPKPFATEESMRLLLNEWQLVTTFKPGTADVRFTSPESWRKYIFEQGPSPVQSLVVRLPVLPNLPAGQSYKQPVKLSACSLMLNGGSDMYEPGTQREGIIFWTTTRTPEGQGAERGV